MSYWWTSTCKKQALVSPGINIAPEDLRRFERKTESYNVFITQKKSLLREQFVFQSPPWRTKQRESGNYWVDGTSYILIFEIECTRDTSQSLPLLHLEHSNDITHY